MTTPKFPSSIDSTMIGTYTECPQKFYLEYCLRLSPRGQSPDLLAGGALAAGMETVRKAIYNDHTPFDIALGMGFEAMARFWGDYEPPAKHPKTFITTCFAMTEYFFEFPPDTDLLQPYRDPEGEAAVEFTFALPTYTRHPESGDPLLYAGRCDMIGRQQDPHGDWINVVVDEKTTKGIGPKWHLKWNLRGQFYGYTYAASQGGINCEHAVVRAISLQTTQSKFSTTLVPIPRWRQERWWRHTNKKISELVSRWKYMQELRKQVETDAADSDAEEQVFIKNAISHDVWPYAFGEACENYGGCAFKSICTSKNPARWYGSFGRNTWDPLAKDPTEGSKNDNGMMDAVEMPKELSVLLGR